LEKEGIILQFNEKNLDINNEHVMKAFNGIKKSKLDSFEEYLKKKVCTNDELELCKKINRKSSNCQFFFNLNYIPISIFLKNSAFYINQYSDFSVNCDHITNISKSNENETRNNVS
jgi:hypothetical protein